MPFFNVIPARARDCLVAAVAAFQLLCPSEGRAEAETVLRYTSQSGQEPSELKLSGLSASGTGTATFNGGALRTTDHDAAGDGRYYTLPAKFMNLGELSQVTLTFEVRVEQSTGSRTATAIELSLPSDVPVRGPFTTGGHGEGYQDILFEGRRISIGMVSDGINHDRDEILLIDATNPTDAGILARTSISLDQFQKLTLHLTRDETGSGEISLSVPGRAPLFKLPLDQFQTAALPSPYSLVFGHPASPGVAVAEWRELELTIAKTGDGPRDQTVPKALVEIGNQHQLFVDDFLVDEVHQLQKVQGTVVKSSLNPVLKREMPWEESRCELYGSAIWNPELARIEMYYSATRQPYDAKLSVAYSTDMGEHWTRPKLNIFDWNGGPSNIVWPGRYWAHGPCVLFDPHDSDPAKRYKLFLTAAPVDPKAENATVGPKGIDAAFSPDGIHWTAAPQNPVIPGFNSDTGNCVIWDEERKLYRAYVRIRCNVGRSVALTESPDFIHWSEPRTIYIPTPFDSAQRREYYGLSVTQVEGLYLGLVWIFPNTPESSNLKSDAPVTWPELVFSHDGEHWQRPFPGEAFVPLGKNGSFDHRQIRPASSMTILPDRLLLLYSGSAQAHVAGHQWDIGLATIRNDGFAAYRAADQAGTVLTRPLKFTADTLHLNAVVRSKGSVSAELVGADGQVLSGYGLADCQTATQGGEDVVISWKTHSGLPSSVPGGVRIRFQIQNADLYSFWLAEAN